LAGLTHLFVQVRWLGDSEVTFSVFGVKQPPVITSLTTQKLEAIPLSTLLKHTTSELVSLSSH